MAHRSRVGPPLAVRHQQTHTSTFSFCSAITVSFLDMLTGKHLGAVSYVPLSWKDDIGQSSPPSLSNVITHLHRMEKPVSVLEWPTPRGSVGDTTFGLGPPTFAKQVQYDRLGVLSNTDNHIILVNVAQTQGRSRAGPA